MAESAGISENPVVKIIKRGNGWIKWGVLVITIMGFGISSWIRFVNLENKVIGLETRMALLEKVPSLEARLNEVERRVIRLEAIADTNREGIRSIDSKLSRIEGMLQTHMDTNRP